MFVVGLVHFQLRHLWVLWDVKVASSEFLWLTQVCLSCRGAVPPGARFDPFGPDLDGRGELNPRGRGGRAGYVSSRGVNKRFPNPIDKQTYVLEDICQHFERHTGFSAQRRTMHKKLSCSWHLKIPFEIDQRQHFLPEPSPPGLTWPDYVTAITRARAAFSLTYCVLVVQTKSFLFFRPDPDHLPPPGYDDMFM